jgi:hypothetical protein
MRVSMGETVHLFEPGGAPCGVAEASRWSATEDKVTCTGCIGVILLRETRERHRIGRPPRVIARIRRRT